MANVYSRFDFCPIEDINITNVRIEGKGEYEWFKFMVGKYLLKDTWYEIEINIKEKI